MQSGTGISSLYELRRYEALLEMADLVVRHHSRAELFHDIALRLRPVADFKFLNFSLHNPEDNSMHLHWWESEAALDLPTKLPVQEAPTGWVWEHQEELLFPDLPNETRFPLVLQPLREHGLITYYVVPLTTADNRLGRHGDRYDAVGCI